MLASNDYLHSSRCSIEKDKEIINIFLFDQILDTLIVHDPLIHIEG